MSRASLLARLPLYCSAECATPKNSSLFAFFSRNLANAPLPPESFRTCFVCATHAHSHFFPQHWLLCHLGLYKSEFEFGKLTDYTTSLTGEVERRISCSTQWATPTNTSLIANFTGNLANAPPTPGAFRIFFVCAKYARSHFRPQHCLLYHLGIRVCITTSSSSIILCGRRLGSRSRPDGLGPGGRELEF